MMKHLFKSTLVLLCALSFSGTYSFAQENNTEKSRFDFSVRLGQGYIAGSTTNLMYGYTSANDRLLSGAIYLGLTPSKKENATGVAFRFLSPSPGYYVDISGKENTLNYAFYVVGAYNRIAIPIRPIKNFNFIFSTEVGMAWMSRHEQIYNSTSQTWDKQRKTRLGLELGLGMHLQYHINKTVYFMAGTDLTSCMFGKRINDYQQKDRTFIKLIDNNIGIGLNL